MSNLCRETIPLIAPQGGFLVLPLFQPWGFDIFSSFHSTYSEAIEGVDFFGFCPAPMWTFIAHWC